MIVGVLTVITSPWIYWKLDNNPSSARFLTPEERLWAVERLRDNNQGSQSNKINMSQVAEALWSPVTWLFVALTFAVNTCASVSNTFGPLIINGESSRSFPSYFSSLVADPRVPSSLQVLDSRPGSPSCSTSPSERSRSLLSSSRESR